jgi:hypothetical protein
MVEVLQNLRGICVRRTQYASSDGSGIRQELVSEFDC